MNLTIANLLTPDNHYVTLGELSRVLSWMLAGSRKYRHQGTWGTFGPTEILCGYRHCTGCGSKRWHSTRKGCKTYLEHRMNLRDTMLMALLDDCPTMVAWRKAEGLSFDFKLRFRVVDRTQQPGTSQRDCEEIAFSKFMELSGSRVSGGSLNSCHRGVNVLLMPELTIGDSVQLTCYATDREGYNGGGWRWDVGFLAGQPSPTWQPAKESFADFLVRGTAWFKAAKRRAA